MAENPIKHSEIIEQGNPFDATIKGLKEMLKLTEKLRKGVKDSAKSQLEFAKKQDTASKKGRENIKKTTTAAAKLSDQEKEMLRVKKALDKELTKATLLQNKEFQAIVKKTEATKRANREAEKTIKKQAEGVKSTNTWAKALGSFAFKFNALGNMAANAMTKIIGGLTRSIKKFTSLEKIMRSNQVTSDRFDRVMGRLESSFRAFNEAVALGDFSNIGQNMRDAADAAEAYVRAMDTLGDTQNAIDIQTARSRLEVFKLQETYNNTANALDERLETAQKAAKILTDLQIQQEKVARNFMEEEIKRVKNRFDLTDEQSDLYRRFIENYGLLTDSQVTKLEELETAQGEVKKSASGFLSGFALMAGASDEVLKSYVDSAEALTDYDKMVKEVSDTFGFDVLPIMETIIKTNDEDRKAVVDKTIAYFDQLRITQRLTNANAAMTGSIIRAMDAEKKEVEVVEDLGEAHEILPGKIDTTRLASQKFSMGVNEGVKDIIKPLKEDIPNATETAEEAFISLGDTIAASFQLAAIVGDAFVAKRTAQLDKELDAVAGNAEKLKEVQKKQAEERKQLAVKQNIINTALAVGLAFAQFGWPAGIIPAALSLAAGLAQGVIIESQQFAEGGHGLLDDTGGVLPGKSHSQGGVNLGQIGEAEGGEYFGIVNKQMTKKYAGELPAVFDSLNNGAFHEVWNRRSTGHDPYNKKIYEALISTPTIIPDGKRMERYPDGRTRIING